MSNRTCNPFPCECCHQVVKSTRVVIKSSTLCESQNNATVKTRKQSKTYIFKDELLAVFISWFFFNGPWKPPAFHCHRCRARYRKHLDGVVLVLPLLCTCVLFLWDFAASPTAGFGLDAGAVKRLVGCGPTQTCSIRKTDLAVRRKWKYL